MQGVGVSSDFLSVIEGSEGEGMTWGHGVEATSFLALCFALGWVLVPRIWVSEGFLWASALRIGWALLFLAGCSATYFSGRFCCGTLTPVLQIGVLSYWALSKRQPVAATGEESSLRSLGLLGLLWIGCVVLAGWQFSKEMPGGALRALHSDLGYAAQLVLGFSEAKASSIWSATMGAMATSESATVDVWYHWSPVWLASAIHGVFDVSAWEALYEVVAPVFLFELGLLSAAMIQVLTGLSIRVSLFAGGASLVGVQWIRMFGVLSFGEWFPSGTLQHTRLSLLGHFPYQYEAITLFLAATAWQHRRSGLCALLVFFVGLSSPHNLAVLGVAAGTLMGMGILLRRRDLWLPACVTVSLLLAAWATLTWGFNVGLPKAEGQSLLVYDWRALISRLQWGIGDVAIGLGIELLLLPGLVFLVQQSKQGNGAALGWLAFSALVGSYLAFHLMRHGGDSFHFTMLAHAAIVMPVSLWGITCWIHAAEGGKRVIFVSLMALCVTMGVHDIVHARVRVEALPCKSEEVDSVRKLLAGRPFGYFASGDRPFWISKHCTLASYLDARCTRLNGISSVDGDRNSQYYGMTRPRELVPLKEGENLLGWSRRLAARLGIQFILVIESDPLPEEMRAFVDLIFQGKELMLFQLRAAPESQL